MEKQYLYILSNDKHPGLLKIGGTSKDPAVRADRLTHQTAAIGKFVVEWYMVVPDWRLAEKMAHFLLKNYHDYKEFHKLSSIDAVNQIQDKISSFFGSYKPYIFKSELFIQRERMIELEEDLKKLNF